MVDPAKRLIEVYETIDGRPALTALANEDERVVLPPLGKEFDVRPFWLPQVSPAP